MKEPLKHFYQRYGFQRNDILKIVVGEKYLAILLIDGRIGVCATLFNEIPGNTSILSDLNLSDIGHRVLYTAYLNAKLNYQNIYADQKDIFNVIDFQKYDELVMIGYFRPLAEKLRNENIPFTIFDLTKDEEEVLPIDQQRDFISKADGIILTATSIFNNTFIEIVENSLNEKCDIFLLGPSAILSEEMLKYQNVKHVFGFIFDEHDDRVLQIIESGGGTRTFNKFGAKVYI